MFVLIYWFRYLGLSKSKISEQDNVKQVRNTDVTVGLQFTLSRFPKISAEYIVILYFPA